jgi:hypothetical protein
VSTRSGLLYLVLLLVLAAFGLLVVALASAQTLWAWGSVLLSVAGAVVLFVDWRRRRRADAGPVTAAEPATGENGDGDPHDDLEGGPGEPQVTGDLDSSATGGTQVGTNRDEQAEPAEEDTDVADALIVSELTDEVRVLDERPRYHLLRCGWLGDRPTIPLPVDEARRLGFTPCALCRPDATLAAAHRVEH